MTKQQHKRHSLKDPKSGKFLSKKKWDRPGVYGFAYWIRDIQPRVLTSSNCYEPFKPTKEQLEIIKKLLAVDEQGNFIHSLSLLVQPRRHGKSTIFALIILWLFTSRQNITIQLLGNHEQHCRRTMGHGKQRDRINDSF